MANLCVAGETFDQVGSELAWRRYRGKVVLDVVESQPAVIAAVLPADPGTALITGTVRTWTNTTNVPHIVEIWYARAGHFIQSRMSNLVIITEFWNNAAGTAIADPVINTATPTSYFTGYVVSGITGSNWWVSNDDEQARFSTAYLVNPGQQVKSIYQARYYGSGSNGTANQWVNAYWNRTIFRAYPEKDSAV